MGFLSSLLGGGAKSKLREPAAAHPMLGAVCAAFEKMDGRPAQALFAEARGQWDVRTALVELAADRYFSTFTAQVRAQMIDGLVPALPGLWQAARGMWHVREGWSARGSGGADTVSEQGWRVLRERCQLALADFRAAAAAEPADPTSHTLTMTVALGLSDRSLGDAAYREAAQRDPHGYKPHARYLGLVSARWFGSHDEMLAAARSIAARAPDGSEAAGLPLLAHFDRYSHACVFDKNYQGATEYLHQPAVQGEVAHACQRSIDAAGHRLGTATLHLRHLAAVMFWEVGDRERCKHQLAQVGDVFDKDAWWQAGTNPEQRYAKVRQTLGLA